MNKIKIMIFVKGKFFDNRLPILGKATGVESVIRFLSDTLSFLVEDGCFPEKCRMLISRPSMHLEEKLVITIWLLQGRENFI